MPHQKGINLPKIPKSSLGLVGLTYANIYSFLKISIKTSDEKMEFISFIKICKIIINIMEKEWR
jgi:hypothetical protein